MHRKVISILVILFGILLLFKACSLLESDEDKIRRLIYAAKEATEKENLIQCMSFISYAYSDRDGNNKAMLFRIGQQVFKSYDSIVIDIKTLEVSILDTTNAQAHLACFGKGQRSPGASAPLALDTQKVEFLIVLQKQNGRWKVVELRFIDPENFMQLLKNI